MKRFVRVLAILAALVVIVMVVGYSLPRGHTASVQRSFDRPAEDIWALITDVERYPEWRSDVERVEVLSSPGERLMWREFRRHRDTITFRVREELEPRKLVVVIADEGLPFGGSWTYDVDSTTGDAIVTITEDGEVFNPFFRFVSHFFIDPTATMTRYLDDLEAALAETPR